MILPSFRRPPDADVYGRIFRSVLWPLWEETLRGRPTRKYLAELEASQWSSLDELRAIQTRALRSLLRHAYENVPFYRRRFQERGLTDADIREAEDLAKLPVLTREEARTHARQRETIAPPFSTIRKNTGGTTGQPLLFGYNPDSDHRRNAMKLRGYAWAGYRPGDRALHFWGASRMSAPAPPVQRAKIALDRWLKRETYVDCAPVGDAELYRVVELIRRERPRALVCFAQAGAELARFVNRKGLRTWETVPVICGAERLFPADRVELERAFGEAVFETYGCREVMLIGAECEAHQGLHTSMENLIVELVVTEDGAERPAREGEQGEVVLTDLHNLGMPFIRYRNGDTAVAGPRERCSCGRSLPRLAAVEGRVADILHDGRGVAVHGLAFNILFTHLASNAKQFQVVQHKDRSITLQVVPGEAFGAATLEKVRRAVDACVQGVPVRVETVAAIPANKSGKRQTVIVET